MSAPRHRLYVIACAAMFIYGIVLGLPGTVLGLPDVAETLGLTLGNRGFVIAALFGGLLIGSGVAGNVVVALGARATLAASSAMLAASLPLFAVASNRVAVAASLALLGLAGAGVNITSNALCSDLFPAERARRMNGIAVAFGCGGLVMSLATALLTSEALSWRAIVIASAVMSGVIAGFAMGLPRGIDSPQDPAGTPATARAMTATAESGASMTTLFGQPEFRWFAVLVMLGAANESSMAAWTSTYLMASGFTTAGATGALSLHWLGLILGRLVFGSRVDQSKRMAIAVGTLAGAAFVGVLVATSAEWLLAAAPFAIGVAIAVVLPTSLALAGERVSGPQGRVMGVLLMFVQVGGMVMPALIGVIAERAGVRVAMSALVVSAVMIAGVVAAGLRRNT